MSQRLRSSGSGRENTPDLSGAMEATRRLVDAIESPSGAHDANVAGEMVGSLGTGRENLNVSTPPSLLSESAFSTTHPPIERYVRADGKIGVIVSRGYHHSPWSTRIRLLLDPRHPNTLAKIRRMEEIAIFDEVIAAVLEEHIPQARRIAIAKMGLPSQIQLNFTHVELGVEWVDPGDEFEVKGSSDFETVRLKNCIEWWRA